MLPRRREDTETFPISPNLLLDQCQLFYYSPAVSNQFVGVFLCIHCIKTEVYNVIVLGNKNLAKPSSKLTITLQKCVCEIRTYSDVYLLQARRINVSVYINTGLRILD